MKFIEIKGKADTRIVALGLAHAIDITSRCVIVTDDVSFNRVGEELDKHIFRCNQVYTAIIPTLFEVQTREELQTIVDAALEEIKAVTGEEPENVILCWSNELDTEYEVRAEIKLFKSGMKTVDADDYEWQTQAEEVSEDGTMRYVLFYDKKKFKSATYTHSEKVSVEDEEMSAIRKMEQDGRFKMMKGGFFSIVVDLAVKRCGVFDGVIREILEK